MATIRAKIITYEHATGTSLLGGTAYQTFQSTGANGACFFPIR
jgi:hypothetical protein